MKPIKGNEEYIGLYPILHLRSNPLPLLQHADYMGTVRFFAIVASSNYENCVSKNGNQRRLFSLSGILQLHLVITGYLWRCTLDKLLR